MISEPRQPIVTTENHITALFCVLQQVGTIEIKGIALDNLVNCKSKIKVLYNEENDVYRFSIREKKRKRRIITPNKKIIT